MVEPAAAPITEPTPTTPQTEPTSTPTPGSQPETNAVSGVFAEPNAPKPEPEVVPQEVPATHAPAPEPAPAPVQAEPESPTAPEPAPVAEPAERVVPKPTEYVMPEGMPPHIREFAHNAGYTQEQLDVAIQQFGGMLTSAEHNRMVSLREAGEAHIRNWGADSETKLNVAKRALLQNDPEGKLGKALNESGYGNHPAVLDFLYNLGKGMQEGGFLKGTVRRPPGQKTAAQSLFGDTHPTEG